MVLVLLSGWSCVVVVVVCDDTCGVESAGNQIAHPAAPMLPIKQVRARYTDVVIISFFTISI